MSAKSPWNTHAVVGIFYPPSFFAAKITIVSSLPPLYNVESIAEAFATWKDTISPSSAICITFKQHCSTGEGIFLLIHSIIHRNCSRTFGRHGSFLSAITLKQFTTSKLSKYVEIKNGVRQKYVMPSDLFNFYS